MVGGLQPEPFASVLTFRNDKCTVNGGNRRWRCDLSERAEPDVIRLQREIGLVRGDLLTLAERMLELERQLTAYARLQGRRTRRAALRATIHQMLAEAGALGLSSQEIHKRIGTSHGYIKYSTLRTVLSRMKSRGQIAKAEGSRATGASRGNWIVVPNTRERSERIINRDQRI